MIAMASIGLLVGVASADQVADRATLEGILGGNGVLENFETADVPDGTNISDAGGLLNSETTFAGQGPGLVQPGADYIAATMWWNGNNYFALVTQTLGDCSGWRGNAITIAYTTDVTAMGFDMQGYTGYSMAGTVTVYDTANNLLGVANVDGGFFGWENADGIGSVVVSANDGYLMIDDHLYGAAGGANVVCFDFDPYCDGLELGKNGRDIFGYWRNIDCAGTDVEVVGRIVGNEGRVLADHTIYGTFGFIIDGLPLDGTMVMYEKDQRWVIWLDPLYYNDYNGPCLFDEGSSISSIMVE